ncbi:MAG: sulfate ABC transporter permease subunit CysW [Verrucomicrobiae bacterium]|nr:sulfate ABC transporter permease subunit CysW [Verrucomicrobiae bacterium]
MPFEITNTRKLSQKEPGWVVLSLLGIVLIYLSLFLFVPLIAVFYEAFSKGAAVYALAITNPMTFHAIWLTLLVALVSVTLTTIFGISAAWTVTKFDFPGKSLLITLIDLPFAISPVICGLMYVLLYSTNHGWFAPILNYFDIKVIFATPGIILATALVVFPFVARELIPLMQAQGREEEISAVVLGANGWQIFWRVTLPNIKWGLLYGLILCNARAMGEFGAVSVVSGHIRGKTNTMPLHIEILYNEYQFAAAFAVSSLLTLLALVTLILKSLIESKLHNSKESEVRS